MCECECECVHAYMYMYESILKISARTVHVSLCVRDELYNYMYYECYVCTMFACTSVYVHGCMGACAFTNDGYSCCPVN